MSRSSRIRFAALLLLIVNIGVLGCSWKSHQRGERATEHDAAIHDADSEISDDSSIASSEPIDPQRAAETAVEAYELTLQKLCLCRRSESNGCEAPWTYQFEGSINRDCVVEILAHDIDLADCVISGVEEIERCFQTEACPYRSCDTASLTEDTPLAEVVEFSCSRELSNKYNQALRAADFCFTR